MSDYELSKCNRRVKNRSTPHLENLPSKIYLRGFRLEKAVNLHFEIPDHAVNVPQFAVNLHFEVPNGTFDLLFKSNLPPIFGFRGSAISSYNL